MNIADPSDPSWISDIATGVGFYAVSIPFFDKTNTLLQENNDGERLRVSFSLQIKRAVLIFHRLNFSIITRSVECWWNLLKLSDV